MDKYLTQELISNCTRFLSQLELSFEYITEKQIMSSKKYLSTIESNQELLDVFIEYNTTTIDQSKLDKILQNKKIKSTEYDFLSDLEMFNGYIDFSIFKNENKNTKKTLVENLHNIYISCNMCKMFKNNTLDNSLFEQITKDMSVLSLEKRNDKKSKQKNKVDTQVEDLLGDFMKDENILDLVNNVSKQFENGQINPMSLLNSLMSNDPTADPGISNIINSISSKVESKIKNGQLDPKQLESQAMNMMSSLTKGEGFSNLFK